MSHFSSLGLWPLSTEFNSIKNNSILCNLGANWVGGQGEQKEALL